MRRVSGDEGTATLASNQMNDRRGADHHSVRLANLSLVLEELRRHGPASRAEIAARVGLARPTLTRLVGELLDLRLVREAGQSGGRPGRPGTMVEIDGAHVFAVGAEINVDAITLIVHDLAGTERARRRAALDARRVGPEASVRRLAALLGDAVAEAARPLERPPEIAGFATAVPGLVDVEGGLLVNAPNLKWQRVPFASLLRHALGSDDVTVSIGNDGNFGALAEYWRGGSAGARHLVAIIGEVGIGAGAVVDGQLLTGSHGRALEVGHLVVDPGGPRCGCGRSGCWEAIVGLDAFLSSLGMPASGRRPEALVKQVVALARRKDSAALAALERLGRFVGIGVANLINTFDPDVVVLGGYFTHVATWLLPALWQCVEAQVIVTDTPAEKLVVPSSLGFRAAALGAALHAAEAVFSNPTLFARPS
ncbi:MAG: ROK family transcriptional regulator [Actinomycetota bacterium]|nr:ROK family transcriptional regulator [Actinomycetota bacterium]